MAYQYNEGVNRFIRATLDVLSADPNATDGHKIGIKAGEEIIDIVVLPANSPELKSMDRVLEFPPVLGDLTDYAIELAGVVSVAVRALGQSIGGKRAAANMTAEERRQRAKKASAAAKALRSTKTKEERRAYQREWMRKKRAAEKAKDEENKLK